MTLNIVANQLHRTGPRIGADKVRLFEFLVAVTLSYSIAVTTRHLFYRVTSEKSLGLPKTVETYEAVQRDVLRLRISGDIAWDAITDGTRSKTVWTGYDSLAEAVEDWADNYRRNIWWNQPVVPEVWTESRGLLGTIDGIASQYGVSTFGMGGYNSATLGWETARDIVERAGKGQGTIIFHVGDYDPSGWDLARSAGANIRARLADAFGWDEATIDTFFEWRSLGLNDAQIRQYGLPSAPPKPTDKRTAKWVVARRAAGEFDEVTELDALDPLVLQQLVENAITPLINQTALGITQTREKAEKATVEAFRQSVLGKKKP